MNRRMWNRGLMLSIVLAIVISTQSVNSQRPRLGRALNILRRFGHLARVMRVMALNVSGSWIYREPSIQIFQTRPESGARFARKVLRGTQAEIQIHYCSNPQKLVQKYFRPFIIEGLKEPAYAFERNWCHSAIARHFGINASYIGNDYKYVLLKVMRRHRKSIMMGPPSKFIVQEAVARETRSLIANDTFSADRFINKFGTHYVSSFVTGDFIYQVFVYRPDYYQWLKRHIRQNVNGSSAHDRSIFFSPWEAAHIGKIRSASGSLSVETWAEKHLAGCYRHVLREKYSSLPQILTNATLGQQLVQLLEDKTLIQMKLQDLSPVFKVYRVRQWFKEYVQARVNDISVRI